MIGHLNDNLLHSTLTNIGRIPTAVALAVVITLSGCRGGDDVAPIDPDFIQAPDPDHFNVFLNDEPAVPKAGISSVDEIHNVDDFPEAYYNTIDPQNSRTTLDDWKTANGFLNADGSLPACDAQNCCVPEAEVTDQCLFVSTHVSFRDTKDLGYGRDMFMRRNLQTNDVAVFVENYQVDSIEGLPYGPLNLEALIRGAHDFQFGVNAIEFSTFPYGAGEPSEALVDAALRTRQFTKFYNFAGRNQPNPGERQEMVDLDKRGLQPMPTACIVCHGGRGRTLVSADGTGRLQLEPTLDGQLPGDVQANMQVLEFDTLQFSTTAGFTRADQEAGVKAINDAVLASYIRQREYITGRFGSTTASGYWDPTLAIENLEGRYATGSYDETFVPTGWRNTLGSDNPFVREQLHTEIVGPNCHVCHALRGSGLNNSVAFADFQSFKSHASRIDHLVFERGLMPLGLLNYRELWDLKDPVLMATVLGLDDKVSMDGSAIVPGAAAAHIAAPLVASVDTDIPISGLSSGFADRFEWSVEPASATIAATSEGEAILRTTEAAAHTVTLTVFGNGSDIGDSASAVVDTSTNINTSVDFFGDDGIARLLRDATCTSCHQAGSVANPAIPVVYDVCQTTNESQRDLLYRQIVARVNFDSPLDSLLLRKPINGATDLQNTATSQISNYHAGGALLGNNPEGLSKMISWINSGAPLGTFVEAVDRNGC